MNTEGMYGISVAVSRANPMIARMIYISGENTVLDLINLSLAALGLPLQKADFLWETASSDSNESQKAVQPGQLLSAVLFPESSGRIILYDKKRRQSIEFFLDIISTPKNGMQPPSIPFISEAIGLNLPKDCFDIAEINELQEHIDEGYKTKNGAYYTRQYLTFSAKRAGNAIRRIFDPDSAEMEPNRSLAAPMSVIFSSIKNNELKAIMDENNIYRDSTMRKSDLVFSLCHHFNNGGIKQIIDSMDVFEYLYFKNLIYSSEKDIPKDFPLTNPSLFSSGLLFEIPKTGIRIAQEVMDYYESMLENDKETIFLQTKYVQTAMRCCANLYGIFSAEMFKSVLKTIAPKDFPLEIADVFFTSKGYPSPLNEAPGKPHDMDMSERRGDYIYSCNLKLLEEGLLYPSELMTKSGANTVFKKSYPRDGLFYKPSTEEILIYSQFGIMIDEKAAKRIIKFFTQDRYFYYFDEDDLFKAVSNISTILHIEGDVISAYDRFKLYWRKFRWGYPDKTIEAEVKAILKEEAKKIPLMTLNGFSISNSPKEILKYVENQTRAAEKKKPAAAKKKKPTARRTSVAKKQL